jgi:hypothetical protein
MQLADVLEVCSRMEARAAAVYRAFAACMRAEPQVAALWEAMAAEEDQHAASIGSARFELPSTCGWRVRMDGWEESIGAITASLDRAERLPADASIDQQLAAAFDVEMSEMEALRHAALAAGRQRYDGGGGDHLARLADVAAQRSSDPHVLMQATLARARARVVHPS